jgi:hypothetical protein
LFSVLQTKRKRKKMTSTKFKFKWYYPPPNASLGALLHSILLSQKPSPTGESTLDIPAHKNSVVGSKEFAAVLECSKLSETELWKKCYHFLYNHKDMFRPTPSIATGPTVFNVPTAQLPDFHPPTTVVKIPLPNQSSPQVEITRTPVRSTCPNEPHIHVSIPTPPSILPQPKEVSTCLPPIPCEPVVIAATPPTSSEKPKDNVRAMPSPNCNNTPEEPHSWCVANIKGEFYIENSTTGDMWTMTEMEAMLKDLLKGFPCDGWRLAREGAFVSREENKWSEKKSVLTPQDVKTIDAFIKKLGWCRATPQSDKW